MTTDEQQDLQNEQRQQGLHFLEQMNQDHIRHEMMEESGKARPAGKAAILILAAAAILFLLLFLLLR